MKSREEPVEPEEDRTPDLRIAKQSFTLAVTFNQSLTHADSTRI